MENTKKYKILALKTLLDMCVPVLMTQMFFLDLAILPVYCHCANATQRC
jgi:hypothetical protein